MTDAGLRLPAPATSYRPRNTPSWALTDTMTSMKANTGNLRGQYVGAMKIELRPCPMAGAPVGAVPGEPRPS